MRKWCRGKWWKGKYVHLIDMCIVRNERLMANGEETNIAGANGGGSHLVERCLVRSTW